MKLLQSIKSRVAGNTTIDSSNPHDNPYYEAVCARVPAVIEGEETVIEFRWIKNKDAKIKGAQAGFLHQGEQVPVVVSSPESDSFSLGINIGFSKILYPSLCEELHRLQEEGLVTSKALLGYNGTTNQAILYRKAGSKMTKGDISKWRDCLRGNLQFLIDDFEAIVPFVMRCFGE